MKKHVLFLLALLLPGFAFADDPADIPLLDHALHRWSSLYSPKLAGEDVLVAAMGYRIRLFDLSQPDDVQILSTIDDFEDSFGITALEVYENYLFVCDVDPLVTIYDITDPSNPTRVAEIPNDSNEHTRAKDVLLLDHYLYVAHYKPDGYTWHSDGGLRCYDIGDLSNITEVSFVPFRNSRELRQGGNLLLETENRRAFDISDPTNPAEIQFEFSLQSIFAGSQYINWNSDVLRVFDVDQTTFERSLLGTCPLPTNGTLPRSVRQYGQQLLINWNESNNGTEESHFGLIDISSPTAPEIIGQYTAGLGIDEPLLGQNRVVYLTDTNGIDVVDISNPANCQLTTSVNRAGILEDVVRVGTTLYAIAGDIGLSVIDISNPEEPRDLQLLGIDRYVGQKIDYVDGLIIVAVSETWGTRRRVYQTLPDHTLEYYGTLDLNGTGPTIGYAVQDDILHCFTHNRVLTYQLAPGNMERLDAYDPPLLWATQIKNIRDHAYLLKPGVGISVLPIRAWGAEGSMVIEDTTITAFEIDNSTIFTFSSGCIKSYSHPDQGAATQLGELRSNLLHTSAKMVKSGGYLYLAQDDSILTVIDCWDPTSMHVTGVGESERPIISLAARDGYIYTNEIDWLGVYSAASSTFTDERSVLQAEDFSLVAVYPNPFNPTLNLSFEVPHAAIMKAVVYDLLGRTVATLADNRPFQPGYHTLSWTPQGSSGVYFVRLEAGNEWHAMRKVVFVK